LTQFQETLARADLIPARHWPEVEQMIASGAKAKPASLCLWLVGKGWLTDWQAEQLLAGRTDFHLGKYKLLDQIGAGGVGQVYRAEQGGLGRVVALKVLLAEALRQPGSLARFQREVQAAASLSHPNIVAVYDADAHRETQFLVMEYVAGKDLSRLLKEQGPLRIDWAAECIRQAAWGLQHAHKRGLVHRDIKPSNLLLLCDADGQPEQVKVLDLGLARVMHDVPDAEELTQENQILGTPDYISPEQAENTHEVDIRADIFSLGVTFFKLLTNELPYPGKSVMEKLMARARRDAPPPSKFRPEISPELDAVVAKMLARELGDRYQTPEEVALALEPFALPNRPDVSGATKLRSDARTGSLTPGTGQTPLGPALPREAKSSQEKPSSISSPSKSGSSSTSSKSLPPVIGHTSPAPETKKPAPVEQSSRTTEANKTPSAAKTSAPAKNNAPAKTSVPADEDDDLFKLAPDKPLAPAVPPRKDDSDSDMELVPLEDDEGASRSKRNAAARTKATSAASSASASGIDRKPSDGKPDDKKQDERNAQVRSTVPDGQVLCFKAPPGEHPGSLQAVTVSANSRYALTGGTYAVQFWDLVSGKEIRQFLGHTAGVEAVALAPSVPHAASAGWDQSVRVWDLQTGKQIRQFEGHTDGIRSVVFSRDGKFVLSAGQDRSIRIWDLATSQLTHWLEHHDWVRSLTLSQDGRFMLLGGGGGPSQDFTVRLWDLTTFQEVRLLSGHTAPVLSVAISPDGMRALSCSEDQTARLWDLYAARELGRFSTAPWKLLSVAYAKDGQTYFTGGEDKLVRVWNAVTGVQLREFAGHSAHVFGVCPTPNSRHLLSVAGDETFRVWKL